MSFFEVKDLSIQFGGLKALDGISFEIKKGEVFAIIKDELLQQGASEEQVEHFDAETESLAAAMQWAGAGDLVIMLALGGAAKIQSLLTPKT